MNFKETDLYLNKNAAMGIAGCLFLLLFITVIGTVYDWVNTSQNSTVQPVIHVPEQHFSLQDISTWHLLGLSPSGDLPETNLQLTLQGVLANHSGGQSSAIIADSGESGKVYRPGDLLPGGAVLDKVMVDKVIIRHRGKLEELPLVRPKLQFAPVPPPMWQGGQ